MSVALTLKNKQTWKQFSRIINGVKVNFRWENLPESRFDEFMDFIMKYYVTRELTHVISDIKSAEAIKEHRQLLSKIYSDPASHNAICCVDDDTNKMVAFNSMKIFRKGAVPEEFVQAKTPEVQRYHRILNKWNSLYPISSIMERHGVDLFFDDGGMAIHPEYCGHGLATVGFALRTPICQQYKVPLSGTWVTSPFVQRVVTKEGWETVYEINSKDLESFLGVRFPATQTFKYNIKKIEC